MKPGSQSGRTPARRRIAPPRLFQRLQRGARGERSAAREGVTGTPRMARRPGAWALAVSSRWLPGSSEARACRAAKKFELFQGAWWDPSRGCRIRRGAVRRGQWERAKGAWARAGAPGGGPCTAQAGMAFVGEAGPSGPPTAQGASWRRAVWPFRVQRSSGELQGSDCC